MSLLTLVFHLLGLTHSIYCLYVYHIYITLNPNIKVGFGGQWQFLTFINLNIQFLFFALAGLQGLLNLFGVTSLGKRLKSVQDVFFASIAGPVCLFVVTSFWIIYAMDREFIYPKSMDLIVPNWSTHFFHTTIISLLLECCFDKVTYPRRKSGITYMMMFGIGYFSWISYVFLQSGSWPYPFMQLMSPTIFFLFMATVFLTIYGFYVLIEKFNCQMSGNSAPHLKAQ